MARMGDSRIEDRTGVMLRTRVPTHTMNTMKAIGENSQRPFGMLVRLGTILLRQKFEEAIGRDLASLDPEELRSKMLSVSSSVVEEIVAIQEKQANFPQEEAL